MNFQKRYGESELLDNFYNESIARTLKEIREEKNLSFSKLCNRMDRHVARQTLCHYEKQETKIRLETFRKIAKAYEMTPEELFDRINYDFFNNIQEYKKKL